MTEYETTTLPAIIESHAHQSQQATNTLIEEIAALRYELKAQSIILARIMAQLDPLFIIPEDHPLRRADSDKIAATVIAKIKAEYETSNPYGTKGHVRG